MNQQGAQLPQKNRTGQFVASRCATAFTLLITSNVQLYVQKLTPSLPQMGTKFHRISSSTVTQSRINLVPIYFKQIDRSLALTMFTPDPAPQRNASYATQKGARRRAATCVVLRIASVC